MTLREQLQRDEHCRLRVYDDSQGVPTIGWGRNLRDKGVSQQEADAMLDRDVLDATTDVLLHFKWATGLDDVRRGVLINMAYNLGIGGLLQFKKMLAAVESGQWDRAAKEMLDSKWARQVGVRAERLAEQMRLGEWR